MIHQKKNRGHRTSKIVKSKKSYSNCDNKFLGRLSCYPCYNNPEGNTLPATEFVRLLEDSGSVTAKQSNGKDREYTVLGSNSRV